MKSPIYKLEQIDFCNEVRKGGGSGQMVDKGATGFCRVVACGCNVD